MVCLSIPSITESWSGTNESVEFFEGKFTCLQFFNGIDSHCDIPYFKQYSVSVPSTLTESLLSVTATVSMKKRSSNVLVSCVPYPIICQCEPNISFSFVYKDQFPQWKVTTVIDKLQILGLEHSNLIFDCISRTRPGAVDLMQQDLKCSPADSYSHEFCESMRIFSPKGYKRGNSYTNTNGHAQASSAVAIYFKLKYTITIPETSKPNPTAPTYGVGDIPETPKDIPPEFASYGRQALNDFETLLNDSSTADIEIKVILEPERTFHCHKAILAARSLGFNGILKNLTETQGRDLEVKDISSKAMGHFLSFLYCARFQDGSWIQSLPELVYASQKYGVNSLKKLCDMYLIHSVTRTNALELGKLASQHKLTKAVADIRKFIAKNIDEISFDG